MIIDRTTAKLLPVGTHVIIETAEGHDRAAIRVTAPYPHMVPAFQWTNAQGEHPLAWSDVEGRVRMDTTAEA